MKLIQKGNGVEIQSSGGVFRIYEGDKSYGAVCIDFVVSDGKGNEVAIPVVTVENPTAKTLAESPKAKNGVTVYIYEDPAQDEYTKKGFIPRQSIVDISKDEGVDIVA